MFLTDMRDDVMSKTWASFVLKQILGGGVKRIQIFYCARSEDLTGSV